MKIKNRLLLKKDNLGLYIRQQRKKGIKDIVLSGGVWSLNKVTKCENFTVKAYSKVIFRKDFIVQDTIQIMSGDILIKPEINISCANFVAESSTK